ncbi:gp43 [Alphaproteobacteria phage PhiJL001]|uniref:Gp43 n=1 Tax=Alphaproteobacteria phage PhiJL001 TaxID=2681607 RepID=Q5DN62_9CAUD|nr:gp43 [Alphaproteobacteria phage PhiJL001]AAT69519.1 gp43 [Alphaproteobacteria phage PhiJL001]
MVKLFKYIEMAIQPDKETKGCHRYAHVGGDTGVTTLYVQKNSLQGERPPEIIHVRIEVKE